MTPFERAAAALILHTLVIAYTAFPLPWLRESESAIVLGALSATAFTAFYFLAIYTRH